MCGRHGRMWPAGRACDATETGMIHAGKRQRHPCYHSANMIIYATLANKPMDKGVYRHIPVIITGAAHTPPQPYMVAPMMETWVRDLHSCAHHPLVAAAEFHFRFEAIHPFIDGNGRTGRLLANFILMRSGYLPVSIKYENRHTYYDAFSAYHKDGDILPMLGIFAECERQRLSDCLSSVG